MGKSKKSRVSKEEMGALAKRIDESLVSFLRHGRYKEVLLLMGNLNRYSLLNQLYILCQLPSATHVAGIKEWNRLGRKVRRGEKGIKIYQPLCRKKEGEEGVYGFRIGYLFDVSQTEGEKLKGFDLDEGKLVSEKGRILLGLGKVLERHGYSFTFVGEEDLGEDCYGLCDHKRRMVKVKEGMEDLQTISTLVHECGHALAHGEKRKDFEGLGVNERREIKEVEAESIACIVCARLGLETEDFNFSYIAAWAKGDIAKFRKNMELVSLYAKELIESIEEERGERDE